ncbi:MAG: molecular chaperone HtpG [Hyphomicrobiales bacterium]|nr:molecular chaperone HtpG [Hyphomicrobiales bacterium]
MTTLDESKGESRTFEADVAKLLHMMVHSVYSDKEVFLRELVANAADACERLRYEAIANPSLLGDDPTPRITLRADATSRRLTVEDNGIGMSRDEMIEALGTIARSGTRAFMEHLEAGKEGVSFIGQFGVGFYSAFMVAERVDVISRRAGTQEATLWSSDGKGTFTVARAGDADLSTRGTRVVLHLMADAGHFTERSNLERIVREQSGHVPVPICIAEKPDAEPVQVTDGAALWAKPRSEISAADYTDFYRSIAGHFDEPALTVHFRAEGRQEYTVLAFVPGSPPFDLFDPERKGHIKLYVKRVFITDEAPVLPRYLRFVRGLVDSTDLPLNISREMIQESPILNAIGKGVTSRVLGELDKLAEKDPQTYGNIWDHFGAVLKEGIYEDDERRETLLELSRFRSTVATEARRSLKDYVSSLKENQTSIYYIVGDDATRLAASPHLEGYRARGIEVLLLTDPVDSFWIAAGVSYQGKPFKSVTQGSADLALIARLDADGQSSEAESDVDKLIAFLKQALQDEVSDVRRSERLTDSVVCLVAPDFGPDRQLAKLLAGTGRLKSAAKPVLEINPRHELVAALAALDDADQVKQDIARLLLDQARMLDGERPVDPKLFGERMTRLLQRGLALRAD